MSRLAVVSGALRSIPLISILGVSALVGCQSVSDQSPIEVQTAKAEVAKAERADIDNTMPSAMELADRKLDRSLELLDDAADYQRKGDEQQAKSTRAEAIKLANEATAIAQESIKLKGDVEAWDKNLAAYESIQARQEKLTKLEAEVAQLRQQNSDLQAKNDGLIAANQAAADQQPETAIPENFRIAKPIAYFGTGSTMVQAKYRDDIAELAEAMAANPELTLVLEGYADSRGSRVKNEALAKKRAEAVAHQLKTRGIKNERIQIEVVGATTDSAAGQKAGDLQLDRKVVAKVVATAH